MVRSSEPWRKTEDVSGLHIVVPNTLRRLATEVGKKPIAHGVGNHFRPTQLGFETKGGCEAAVHAARQYLNGATQRRVLLKLDVRNGFYCMRSAVSLRATQENVPSMYRLLWQTCHEPYHLYFCKTVINFQSLEVDCITKFVNAVFKVWFLD